MQIRIHGVLNTDVQEAESLEDLLHRHLMRHGVFSAQVCDGEILAANYRVFDGIAVPY